MRLSALLLGIALSTCKTTSSAEPAEDVVEQYTDELQVEDLVTGTGAAAADGMTLTVNYTGWLTTGERFDTSLGREPFTFKLGARKVIRGWDQGLAGMRVGGKRKLIIPPRRGYGAKATGSIPPGSRLIFEVSLLNLAP